MTLVPVTGAAIVEMIDANRGQTVCATDDVSEALATLRFTLGEGPCVQAMTTGRPVLVSDLHEVGHPHWPVFGRGRQPDPGPGPLLLSPADRGDQHGGAGSVP
jgi:hypothetical protein